MRRQNVSKRNASPEREATGEKRNPRDLRLLLCLGRDRLGKQQKGDTEGEPSNCWFHVPSP